MLLLLVLPMLLLPATAATCTSADADAGGATNAIAAHCCHCHCCQTHCSRDHNSMPTHNKGARLESLKQKEGLPVANVLNATAILTILVARLALAITTSVAIVLTSDHCDNNIGCPPPVTPTTTMTCMTTMVATLIANTAAILSLQSKTLHNSGGLNSKV